ncbi:uncharacterized protein LOC141646723 [Silene latifolia]|uniref:uncharacterized protein LOC141646723 n=1 Tax=Silene latifolia TaxID=37657 RepID=UPI003D774404
MAFRSKETMKKILKKVGEENMTKGVKNALKKSLPNNKVVMGRANRGLFAGRHIQFGNQISEDGGNKSRRSWKPNVQKSRLFSYILDRQIRVKVTTHALRCIDKAGGIDEYLLKTPYHKMDTEMGVLWKAKIEKLYEELGQRQVSFISQEDESKFVQSFQELKLDEKAARKEFRRRLFGFSAKPSPAVEGTSDTQGAESDSGSSHSDHEQMAANA